jgi:repressor LexA
VKTAAQSRVYDYVIEFINDHGYSPTVRQVCDALGYSSTATVQQHIRSLVAKGYLQGAGRSLQPGDAE